MKKASHILKIIFYHIFSNLKGVWWWDNSSSWIVHWELSLLHTLAQGLSLTPKRQKSFTPLRFVAPPTFYVSGDQHGLTEQFTYLGSIITFTCDLTAEIQNRVNLASASFGRLSKRVFTNHDLSTRNKMAVYNAICVSKLFYACEGWTPYCRHMRALEAFHIRRLQTILHVHWWDKIRHAEICRRAGTTALEMILLRRQLRWLDNVKSMPGNRRPRHLFYSELSCGQCSVGVKRSVFEDHIKSSLSKCGIPFDRLEKFAGHREDSVQFATRCWQHLNSNILMW